MTKKRNSEVSTSPSLKKQKSPVHKKPSLLIRKKTSVPKLLLGLRRYLASSDGNRKRKAPVESPPVLPIQASSDDKRKRKSPPKSLPVLPIQASSGCIRKRKSPARSSPVLTIQAPIDDSRELMSSAKSPSVFPFEDESSEVWEHDEHDLPEVTSLVASSPCQLNNQESTSEQSVATAEMLNRVIKSEMTDESSEAWEHDEHDLPEVTSLVASSPCPASMKILRESNAVSPATVVPAPSQSAKVRVGFDRNLEPQKIVKMAELRGKDYFIMKWKGSEIMDIVPTEIAKERCPQVVIAFYEKHLTNVHNRAMDNIE